MDVDRLDRVAADEVDGVQALGQAQEVAEIGLATRPPAALEIGAVGRARDAAEDDLVAADAEIVRGIARVEREALGRLFDRVLDHPTVEPHPLAAGLDQRPGRPIDVARLGQDDVHPNLLEDRERGLVDRLELVGRDRRGRRVGEPQATPGALDHRSRRVAASPAPLAAPFARVLDHASHLARGHPPAMLTPHAQGTNTKTRWPNPKSWPALRRAVG